MSPDARSGPLLDSSAYGFRGDGPGTADPSTPAGAAGSAPRRESARSWRVSVEHSPSRLAWAAVEFWHAQCPPGRDEERPSAELADACRGRAESLRPFESDCFRLESCCGFAIDVSIYRGPRDWVLLRRLSQAHADGLGSLAFVYSALARSRDAVVYTDASGALLGASERWLALYGYTHLDVLGENPRLINSRQHPRSFFRDLFTQLVDPAIGTWSGELINRSKSGDLIQVSQTITSFRDASGAVSGYLGITRDLTSHRELRERLVKSNEELDSRLHAQNELLSMTVHDLRAPLHAVLGFIELASSDRAAGPGERSFARLDRAREAAERMEMMIQTLLDAQRARSGRLELAPSRVWVTSIVRSEVELHRVQAARRGISIVLSQSGPSLPGFFDELRLGEALSNVIGNAVKFSPSGSTVQIRYESTATGDHEICVDDRGIGIPAGEREAVFDLFYQTHSSSQPVVERKGSGWGLFIAKRVVELHGGEITALDAPGGGCRIRLRFSSLAQYWDKRPWAAVVFDPVERIWAPLSARLGEWELPALSAHSLADLELLVAKELPNLIFAPAGAFDLRALARTARSPDLTGCEPAVFLVKLTESGVEIAEAAGPPNLLETVRHWFEEGHRESRPSVLAP